MVIRKPLGRAFNYQKRSDRHIHPFLIHVSHRVRAARIARRLTQVQLAEMMGITQSSLIKLEWGVRGFTLPRLLQVAEALNVPYTELIAGYQSPKPVYYGPQDLTDPVQMGLYPTKKSSGGPVGSPGSEGSGPSSSTERS